MKVFENTKFLISNTIVLDKSTGDIFVRLGSKRRTCRTCSFVSRSCVVLLENDDRIINLCSLLDGKNNKRGFVLSKVKKSLISSSYARNIWKRI